MSVALDTLLVRTPGVCGGRLRIDGTRITVLQIATLFLQGLSAEGIADQYPHLTLAQVYAALAYFHANRAEVEAELAAEELRWASLFHDPDMTPAAQLDEVLKAHWAEDLDRERG